MTFRSSFRAGGGWRVAAALLLALAFAAAVATPQAQAGAAYFCPGNYPSSTLTLGATNGCTGGSSALITQVSFFQRPSGGSHCAVGKQTTDPDSAVLIAAVCGAGSGSNGEVATYGSGLQLAFPRGRNDTGSTQNNYWGQYIW
ncbi:hypothetical protein Q5424_14375 [Conexibacter sp. JD483]|uniref:hypothetical protein n=1 Tax=unclassified Conexibacter TaxID=2627773 RepID=UPI0027222A2C|nr:MULTISPECIES: hypothetical protein [unclassified Conexibacter]MDO8186297.1 hypothetical protein [Conexibacter sp. CPCC 205706]MDO8197502.1 hypothetical protein [Conexibacter sp. CPCC 205762]MDR9370285.1 hypothetical protein [Conexibacter sp. JD483]